MGRKGKPPDGVRGRRGAQREWGKMLVLLDECEAPAHEKLTVASCETWSGGEARHRSTPPGTVKLLFFFRTLNESFENVAYPGTSWWCIFGTRCCSCLTVHMQLATGRFHRHLKPLVRHLKQSWRLRQTQRSHMYVAQHDGELRRTVLLKSR